MASRGYRTVASMILSVFGMWKEICLSITERGGARLVTELCTLLKTNVMQPGGLSEAWLAPGRCGMSVGERFDSGSPRRMARLC